MSRNNKCQNVSNRCCNVVLDAAQSGGHLREDKPRRCKLTAMRIAIISLSILLLSGCWSRREIEDLNITVAAALDIGHISSEEQEFEKKGADYPRNQRITLTYQMAKPEQSSGQDASGSKRKYRNVSLSGDSLYQISRETSLKETNPIFGQHYKALVIGSGLAQQLNLRDVLDFFMREQEFRPSCLVYISRGTGKEVLDVNLPGDVPAFRLLGISDNHYRTNRLLKPLSLTNLLEKLNLMTSFMIQNVVTAKGELKLSGASIISGSTGKQLGYLDEEDMEAVNWVLGGSKGGVVKSKDIITNQVTVYEITNVKSQITPHVENGRISFDVKVKSDGRLGEQMISDGNDFDNKFIRRLEDDAEKQIKELVTKLLDKLQKKYHADVLGFSDKLRIAYPRLWEKEKKTWDETFATTPIRYDVQVTIREFGTTNMRARQVEGQEG
ncbi:MULTISPECIES: Ger(x)C family spore germination protein [Paenibacillus]|uniref:Ger(X)C family spore germination protein n=1 Tax=Paenibacillus alvei TaxID=44250 RepID=A0ABT4EE71_PAEAL|nr:MULTISPECIES: Ger(x)C family spore germination protein [Paenibacillus]EPY10806.1 spore germination protein [Paenibacillus alvei A6-6i-x]MCY9532034.1 Ger(x)C family spore germination protein [Paenibacillus alvei]SDF31699.1 spore germination protein [Paenibacillus sp. cl6col]